MRRRAALALALSLPAAVLRARTLDLTVKRSVDFPRQVVWVSREGPASVTYQRSISGGLGTTQAVQRQKRLTYHRVGPAPRTSLRRPVPALRGTTMEAFGSGSLFPKQIRRR